MDQNVQVGDIGNAEIKIQSGIASASFTGSKSFFNGALTIKSTDEVDLNAIAVLEILKAYVESKLPAGKAIEDFAFAELETFLKTIA